MWDVKGHLLSDQHFKSHPSHANIICCMLSTRYWVMMGDFHKTVLGFIFLLTLAAPLTVIIDTLCLPAQVPLENILYFKWQPAYLSVCVCVLYLLMN